MERFKLFNTFSSHFTVNSTVKRGSLPNFSGRLLVTIMLGAALCTPSLTCAQSTPYITDKDLQVAVRTFSFAYGMPKGDLDIDIVYDPSNPVSTSDANQLRDVIGSGGVFSSRTIKAKMVPISEMGSMKSRIAYITHGLQEKYGDLLQSAKSNKMLTFSTDFQCVENQKCVMGVTADPTIKIEISRSATATSELEFSQALKLMIREVE